MRVVFTGAQVWDARVGRAESADVLVEAGIIVGVGDKSDGEVAV